MTDIKLGNLMCQMEPAELACAAGKEAMDSG